MKTLAHVLRTGLLRAWSTRVALLVSVLFVVVGVAAPLLVPQDPNAQNLGARLLPPLSDGHLLGTDLLGRDVLSRLIMGTRVALIVALVAVTVSVLIGVVVGLVSGYYGGWVDSVLMRIIDAWLAFPFLLLAIAIVAILGPGLRNVIIALIASGWVLYVRLVRGETLSLREREFVASARMLGVGTVAIMVKHILPNIFAPIMVVATLEIGVVIVTEASLSFLGLGVDAAQPTWGSMLADGKAYVATAWWLALLPGLMIFLIALAVNIVGDALRDLLDPRTKSSARSVDPELAQRVGVTGDARRSAP
ncbi:ABC transporter permease [Micromonospora carbonacea]|uniref:Peptide/nickel transport system permease protein n=1 Tax=Micromonospora carbonacea TaxID=47853 RepID=A0A1C4V9U8_9ACTN|nr:ABC transporter permease [Micromonospora carbonacea]SCE80814.1 peptide/nickel transport system permease protein [Micromonospora carbonacea]